MRNFLSQNIPEIKGEQMGKGVPVAGDIGKLRKEWGEKLHLFAYSYVHSFEVAEDLVQDVFLKILEQNMDLSGYRNAGSLLYTILRNKCRDYIKHKRVEESHIGDVAESNYLKASKYALEDESIKIITDNEIRKILRSAIDSLPGQTREVFILSKFKDKKYQEIADMLGISSRQVEYHIAKAMSLLKERMGEYYILVFFFAGLF